MSASVIASCRTGPDGKHGTAGFGREGVRVSGVPGGQDRGELGSGNGVRVGGEGCGRGGGKDGRLLRPGAGDDVGGKDRDGPVAQDDGARLVVLGWGQARRAPAGCGPRLAGRAGGWGAGRALPGRARPLVRVRPG
ncbi:hypothetical protein JCM4814A_00200 [Streptomyces phaeofaciens JCM 4814]|uniref:Uncharacterized protein n=1 Tax=Streptomyces phaeofaciens TaxID=68254 RepID=A0A918M1J4_9ACTN|nr:hypothetical protein GCM10010226_88150 [Streptomyces phaeofaciens]